MVGLFRTIEVSYFGHEHWVLILSIQVALPALPSSVVQIGVMFHLMLPPSSPRGYKVSLGSAGHVASFHVQLLRSLWRGKILCVWGGGGGLLLEVRYTVWEPALNRLIWNKYLTSASIFIDINGDCGTDM